MAPDLESIDRAGHRFRVDRIRSRGPFGSAVASGLTLVRVLHSVSTMLEIWESEVKAFDVVESLSALAHEHRLAIYRLLVQAGPEGMSAGSIANEMRLPASSFTFHVQHLHRARLISQQRVSRQIFYRADFAVMNGLLAYLTENCCSSSGAPCSTVGRSARATVARRRDAKT